MQERLTEALEIIEQLMELDGRYPIGLVRVHRLLNQVLDDCWDEGDVPVLVEDAPFPAA